MNNFVNMNKMAGAVQPLSKSSGSLPQLLSFLPNQY